MNGDLCLGFLSDQWLGQVLAFPAQVGSEETELGNCDQYLPKRLVMAVAVAAKARQDLRQLRMLPIRDERINMCLCSLEGKQNTVSLEGGVISTRRRCELLVERRRPSSTSSRYWLAGHGTWLKTSASTTWRRRMPTLRSVPAWMRHSSSSLWRNCPMTLRPSLWSFKGNLVRRCRTTPRISSMLKGSSSRPTA